MTRRYLMAAAAAAALSGAAFADKKPAPIVPLDEAAVPAAIPAAMPAAPLRVSNEPLVLPDAGRPAASPIAIPPAECAAPGSVAVTEAGGEKDASTWVSGEYLFTFVKPGNVPFALGSAGPVAGVGVLGTPGTRGLFGPRDADYGMFAGLRIGGGRWLDDCRRVGVEGSLFLLERRSVGDTATATDADPVLARPFRDANTGAENARLLTVPGRFVGAAAFTTSSRVWGADADVLARLTDRGPLTLSGTAGFKFLSLDESLDVYDRAQAVGTAGVTAFNGAAVTGPATTAVHDHFSTQNRFYGGSVGLKATWEADRWFACLAGKVALGDVHETVNVDGTTTLGGVAPAAVTAGGGLLADSSNYGRYTRDRFAVLPEVQFRVGYRITPHLAVTAGYQYQYISEVVRPGDQLDRTVNTTLVPSAPGFGVPFGPARPAMPFQSSDFWLHGATVGLMGSF